IGLRALQQDKEISGRFPIRRLPIEAARAEGCARREPETSDPLALTGAGGRAGASPPSSDRHPPIAPWSPADGEYSEWLAAINSRLRLMPPKQTLALRSGSEIEPMRLPSGLNTTTPSSPSPMPQPHHRLPSVSQRKPSGVSAVSQVTNALPLASLVPLST